MSRTNIFEIVLKLTDYSDLLARTQDTFRSPSEETMFASLDQ